MRFQAANSALFSRIVSRAPTCRAVSGTVSSMPKRSARLRKGRDNFDPPAFEIHKQGGMRIAIERKAAQLHSDHRRHDGHLDGVGARLHAQRRQRASRQPATDDDIRRGVAQLFHRKVRRVPVGRLQRLIDLNAEKFLRSEFKSRPVLAGQKTARLEGAMDFAGGDTGLLQNRQFEGRVVRNDTHVFETLEEAKPGAVEIDHRGVRSATIKLQQPRAGTVRVETGFLSVVDRYVQALDLGLAERRAAA